MIINKDNGFVVKLFDFVGDDFYMSSWVNEKQQEYMCLGCKRQFGQHPHN